MRAPTPIAIANARPLGLLGQLAERADEVRRLLWRIWVRVGGGQWLISHRDARLATIAVLQMVTALCLAITIPQWLLLLGPIILGVPHIFADVRYLILRPVVSLSARSKLAILLPLAALTVVRGADMLFNVSLPWLEVALGMTAIGGALVTSHWRRQWKAALGILAAALTVLAVAYPLWATLAMAHLHNFVAVGLWIAWSAWRRPSQWASGVGLFFIAVSMSVLAGAADNAITHFWSSTSASGIDLGLFRQALAPGASPLMGMRVVVIFAFAQAVHYSVWLRLLPGSEPFEPRRGPTTFARNLRRLELDFGRIGARLVVLAVLAMPLCGLMGARATRDTYLALVVFHGWLELAVATYASGGAR